MKKIPKPAHAMTFAQAREGSEEMTETVDDIIDHIANGNPSGDLVLAPEDWPGDSVGLARRIAAGEDW